MDRDVQTDEKYLIGTVEEDFHTPHLSPNGLYIAVLHGTSWSDACFVDLGVAVLEIIEELERVNSYYLRDFAGLPKGNEYTSIYPLDLEDIPILGVWQCNAQIMVELKWACIPDDPKGVYMLDIKVLNAEKVSDLEGE